MPLAVLRRLDAVVPRAVGLQQEVLRGPRDRRRFPRDDERLPRLHDAHLRVHQAVVVAYVDMGVVLHEVEALLPAVVFLDRLAPAVEADVPRLVGDAPVAQILVVVDLEELAHRSLLLLRLKVDRQRFTIRYLPPRRLPCASGEIILCQLALDISLLQRY